MSLACVLRFARRADSRKNRGGSTCVSWMVAEAGDAEPASFEAQQSPASVDHTTALLPWPGAPFGLILIKETRAEAVARLPRTFKK